MSNLRVVDESDFDEFVLGSPVPVLVDFFTEWCAPCKALAPTLEDLSAEYGDKVRIVSVDAEASPALKDRYGVTGYPTMVLVKDGVEVSRPQVRSRVDLRAVLETALGNQVETATEAVPVEVPASLRPLLDQLLALDDDAWKTIDAYVIEDSQRPAPEGTAGRSVDEEAMTAALTRLQNDVEELAAARIGASPLAAGIASAAAASFDRWVRQSPIRPGWVGAFRFVPAVRMSPFLPAVEPPVDPREAAALYVTALRTLDAATWESNALANQDFFPFVEHRERCGMNAWFAAVILIQATMAAHLVPAEVLDACWAPFSGILDREVAA